MILTSPEVELLSHTPNPELILSEAYAVCRLKEPEIARVIKYMKAGHLSPLEHVVYTFRLKVSRACWSQIEEYRTASHTAQSHRYWHPDYDKGEGWDFIVPPELAPGPGKKINILDEIDVHTMFEMFLVCAETAYRTLIEGFKRKPETARLILPMCTAITVIWTQDLRNLLHFWDERCAPEAQWEIRQVAEKTRELVQETLPNIDLVSFCGDKQGA